MASTSHLPGPATVETMPEKLYRVARRDQVLTVSRIDPADAALPRSGNRFDVAGGGVLYCGTTARGCFAETLARFRPSPAMRKIVTDEDPGFVVCGGVPQDWRTQRLLAEVTPVDPLPFLDVEHPDTHEFLTTAIAAQLTVLDVGVLDVAGVRGPNRALTRAIATWAYTATDTDGAPLYSGIRYVSRLGEHECWAVFDGTDFRVTERNAITLSNPDLRSTADAFGLRIF